MGARNAVKVKPLGIPKMSPTGRHRPSTSGGSDPLTSTKTGTLERRFIRAVNKMALETYDYTKERGDFGAQPHFEDTPTRVNHSIVSPESDIDVFPACMQCNERVDPDVLAEPWVLRRETIMDIDCTPQMSEHEVNTLRVDFASKGMEHTSGGWPFPEVKTNEATETDRFVERIKMNRNYSKAVAKLTDRAEDVVRQNNTIDMFEEYFAEEVLDLTVEPPAAKTVAVFRDRPNRENVEPNPRRPVTYVCWHPDGSSKLATSYSVLQFQQMPDDMPLSSYIWDVNSPNEPVGEVLPKSPLCCLVYNPKTSDHLVGGSYNGLVGFWDTRRGKKWIACSDIESSHHDPVYNIFWIQSRTGNECASVSTDGQLLWWDVRNLRAGPTDTLLLKRPPPNDVVFGGTRMEYRTDAGPTRYLVGTEQGQVLLLDRKAKGKDAVRQVFGEQSGRHHGPIYALQRNPTVSNKYFLTVGDWTTKIWNEDQKTPILTTRYDSTYLTGGCWSPTRPGVFFTTKLDGSLDVWDMFYKQNDPAFSTKIGESSLSSIAVHQRGKLVAVGSEDGTTSILEISESLAVPQDKEKKVMADVFDRESKREKQLGIKYDKQKKARSKDHVEKKKDPERELKAKKQEEDKLTGLLKEVEESFFSKLGIQAPEFSLADQAAAAQDKGADSKPASALTDDAKYPERENKAPDL